jgi:hypothetical protein
MSKRSMQKKVALLQSHFDGEIPEDEIQMSGDWSSESIAENRRKYYEKETPWVLKKMSAFQNIMIKLSNQHKWLRPHR